MKFPRSKQTFSCRGWFWKQFSAHDCTWHTVHLSGTSKRKQQRQFAEFHRASRCLWFIRRNHFNAATALPCRLWFHSGQKLLPFSCLIVNVHTRNQRKSLHFLEPLSVAYKIHLRFFIGLLLKWTKKYTSTPQIIHKILPSVHDKRLPPPKRFVDELLRT